MKELKLSPDFTVEDIHKLRQYDYERRQGMTENEVIAEIRKGANEVLKRIGKPTIEKTAI